MVKKIAIIHTQLCHLFRHRGMTLIEVAIAVLLFSVFAVAFISGQGSNVFDSIRIKRELRLRDLAELKLNEIILDPPEFKETLTSAGKTTKPFEEFPDYQYTLEFKKIIIPDLTKIAGEEDEDEEANKLQKKIFSTIKENMEKMIWQVSLVVTHKESTDSFEITSWLHNSEVEVTLNAF